MAIFNQPLSSILNDLSTSKNGLPSSSVQNSREKHGENRLLKQKKVSLLARFFTQFKNLMVIVLLVSAVISLIIALAKHEYSDLFEGFLIFIIVILNAIIGVVQEKRADDAIALLSKQTQPFSRVYRDGKLQNIPAEEVVVGDIVQLKAGDIVPADIRLISCNNLKCDESTLTGESQGVFKNADAVLPDGTPLAEQETMCFAGTVCTFGNAKGVVVRVGQSTEMGKIAGLLSSNVKEKTPLEKTIDKIGKIITIGVLLITAVVFVIELIFSREMSFMDSFLVAVALAVAAIPESLPAVITIVMALGVERLAKQRAIVKTLSSVETLGCCNVICTDKTGTLTQNKMTVKHMYFDQSVTANFSISSPTLQEMFRAMTLCNNAEETQNGEFIGEATETSMLAVAKANNSAYSTDKACPRLYEIPFDSTRKIMSTLNRTESGNVLYSKGAYDYLISRCNRIYLNGQILPLDPAKKQDIEQAIIKMARQAERVLAVTMKLSHTAVYSSETEDELVFLGLVGIVDPPRAEAKQSIAACKKAGLRPVMITGDHPETAFAIAYELGIAKKRAEVMTGAEIDKLSVGQLAKVIDGYHVFARVSPEHKVKIVSAYKKSGKVVAMTGDGVNDAPSIAKADIGVCMGKTGTDVTKSVADLVITDDNYSTIILAIRQGRTIYSNIQKILLFLMSTNAVEVLGIFVATIVMRNNIFLLPSQILFINLVTDSFPAFALGLEKPEKGVMERPPREKNSSIFAGRVGTSILYESFVQTLLVLVVFVVGVHTWGNEVASTMVFLIICLMQIIHAINCKTEGSIFKINIFNNPSFNLSFIGLFALIMVVAFVPILQTAFGIVPLNALQWLIVALASISIIPLVEACKLGLTIYEKLAKKRGEERKGKITLKTNVK